MNIHNEIFEIKKVLDQLLQKEAQRDREMKEIKNGIVNLQQEIGNINQKVANIDKSVNGIKEVLKNGFRGMIDALESPLA